MSSKINRVTTEAQAQVNALFAHYSTGKVRVRTMHCNLFALLAPALTATFALVIVVYLQCPSFDDEARVL